ncbi:hypothetical protein P9X50_24070, partial [Bacillus cereus]|nr:hypothetical protein [Bacillus cereus]
ITHKHFVSENLDFEYIFSNNKVKCISAVISELECYFNINLSKKEVNFFKLSFFLISKGKKDEKVNITNYYKTKEKTYDKFLSVFNMISHKLNMGFKTKEKVKDEIFFTLHIINIFNAYNISIGEFWSEFETVPQEFLEGYNIIYPLISSWNKEINQNRLTKNEIYYMTYNILFILHSNYAKKGLLLLSGPTSLKNFIYYKLNKELGDILTLQQKTDYTNKYDFILTNYQITNSQIPIIQISSKTIQQDMCYIKKIISPYNKE